MVINITIEKMEAISDECPNGSICHATRGLASSPNVSSTNFNPITTNFRKDRIVSVPIVEHFLLQCVLQKTHSNTQCGGDRTGSNDNQLIEYPIAKIYLGKFFDMA